MIGLTSKSHIQAHIDKPEASVWTSPSPTHHGPDLLPYDYHVFDQPDEELHRWTIISDDDAKEASADQSQEQPKSLFSQGMKNPVERYDTRNASICRGTMNRSDITIIFICSQLPGLYFFDSPSYVYSHLSNINNSFNHLLSLHLNTTFPIILTAAQAYCYTYYFWLRPKKISSHILKTNETKRNFT